jgi:hypothetical protein
MNKKLCSFVAWLCNADLVVQPFHMGWKSVSCIELYQRFCYSQPLREAIFQASFFGTQQYF